MHIGALLVASESAPKLVAACKQRLAKELDRLEPDNWCGGCLFMVDGRGLWMMRVGRFIDPIPGRGWVDGKARIRIHYHIFLCIHLQPQAGDGRARVQVLLLGQVRPIQRTNIPHTHTHLHHRTYINPKTTRNSYRMNLWRSWLTQTRDSLGIAVGVVMNAILGLVFGVLYFNQIPVRRLAFSLSSLCIVVVVVVVIVVGDGGGHKGCG